MKMREEVDFLWCPIPKASVMAEMLVVKTFMTLTVISEEFV